MKAFIERLEICISQNQLLLQPSQSNISIPIVFRIYKKMLAGIAFDAIKVCEDVIIDGHHRYTASILAEVTIEQYPSTKNHNQNTFEWNDVTLSDIDYDSLEDVKYHNYNDAKRNGMNLEDLENILND